MVASEGWFETLPLAQERSARRAVSSCWQAPAAKTLCGDARTVSEICSHYHCSTNWPGKRLKCQLQRDSVGYANRSSVNAASGMRL